MQTPSYIALSRQTALWRQMDVVANNIANMNTPGFKGESLMFSEYRTPSRGTDSAFADMLSYTYDFGSHRDVALGPMEQTGNPLDLAINGPGYFEVETDFGRFYTRNGRFMLDADGMVVTGQGHPVLSTNGTPFFVAPNERDIVIARDGTVSTENGAIGQLNIVSFEDEQALLRVQAGLYDAGEQDPQAAEGLAIEQGMLEGSNVEPTREITRLIDTQRAYEAVQKLIEDESDRQQRAIKALTGADQV
ncbi:flagellar basal-body rod protein FlgF [Roseospira marina]|uniref:Flagellar basal-body rod protein FlgF n=1 Tax=Roseospira marina TaxID=140057 RepID=A0A5M6IG64_9PROT|nr:flagellar basal-body rod protein FlgF [Roseospira marina]KAA5606759.1 flagellar basal-body rod protein FlgF [Roseospira marina]MBB4313819.1 flagellar basal-body rod protein FlgF [Roseospira marina]MBB5086981.1 flagellar basal-body rod protein FlgF [Roseospira marina]